MMTAEKARTMLRHGKAHGKELTGKQRKLAGLIASGKMPTRLQDMPKSVRKKLMSKKP
jgi:hypothetical protein